MPSPFHFPMNTSRRTDTDREPLAPVPEEYEGFNNPYRGTEPHGVEPTVEPSPVPGHASGRIVEYDEPLPEPEPVPVVVVNTGARELRRNRFYQPRANVGAASQLVGRDEQRITVKLKNMGASTVYISDDQSTANANHGWPLDQNEVYESDTQDELWALSSHATDPMPVAVSVLYAAEL